MCLCVCGLCGYLHVGVHVHMCVSVCVCICSCGFLCSCVHVCACICVYLSMWVPALLCTCPYYIVCLHVCVHIYVCVHGQKLISDVFLSHFPPWFSFYKHTYTGGGGREVEREDAMEVSGQLAGVNFLLQPCGFWEWNSGLHGASPLNMNHLQR